MTSFVEQYSGSKWNYLFLALNLVTVTFLVPRTLDELFVSGYVYMLTAYLIIFYVTRKNIKAIQELPEAKTSLKKELWYWNVSALIVDITFLIGWAVSYIRTPKTLPREVRRIFRPEDFPVDDSTDSLESTRGSEDSASLEMESRSGDRRQRRADAMAQPQEADAQRGNYDIFYVSGAGVGAGVAGPVMYYAYQDDPRAAASEEKYPDEEKRAIDISAGFTPLGTPIYTQYTIPQEIPRNDLANDLSRKGKKGWKRVALRALQSQGKEMSRVEDSFVTAYRNYIRDKEQYDKAEEQRRTQQRAKDEAVLRRQPLSKEERRLKFDLSYNERARKGMLKYLKQKSQEQAGFSERTPETKENSVSEPLFLPEELVEDAIRTYGYPVMSEEAYDAIQAPPYRRFFPMKTSAGSELPLYERPQPTAGFYRPISAERAFGPQRDTSVCTIL